MLIHSLQKQQNTSLTQAHSKGEEKQLIYWKLN